MTVWRDGPVTSLGLLIDPQPGMLAYVEDIRHARLAAACQTVAAVITKPELAVQLRQIPALAVTAQPKRAFFVLHNWLARETEFYGTSYTTEIHPTARIHPRAYVAERDVRIGPDCVIEPNAVVLERCELAAGVRIGAGAVLGAEGFQTVRGPEEILDLEHAGGIQVGAHARILAHAAVARALFRQDTLIGQYAHIGCQSFVSHNVHLGERSLVGHGAVVNGNVRIGDDVWIGPGATISHGLRLQDRAEVSLGAVVVRDVASGERVSGNFAVPHGRLLRQWAKS